MERLPFKKRKKYILSEEAKKAIGQNHKGKQHSPETIGKMRASYRSRLRTKDCP